MLAFPVPNQFVCRQASGMLALPISQPSSYAVGPSDPFAAPFPNPVRMPSGGRLIPRIQSSSRPQPTARRPGLYLPARPRALAGKLPNLIAL